MSVQLEQPRLSAASLSDLERCPRRFALRYRLNRYWPGPLARSFDPEAETSERTGYVFHRLVQQHALGMDVARMVQAAASESPRLVDLWRRFEGSPYARCKPPIWSEAPLHFTLAEVPFFVRFDRLVQEGTGWEILDWKTGKETPLKLERSLQTRLYRFALALAGHVYNDGRPIRPEQIRLTYWDVGHSRPHSFAYDGATFQADRQFFEEKAREAMRPFDPQLADDPQYPKTTDVAMCARCRFDSYCHPHEQAPPYKATQLQLPLFVLPQESP